MQDFLYRHSILTMALVLFLVLAMPSQAQEGDDPELEDPEVPELSVGEEEALARNAGPLGEALGDDAQAWLTGLRTGEDFAFDVRDENGDVIDTEVLENGSEGMGIGGAFISLALAVESLEGVEEPTREDVANALFGHDVEGDEGVEHVDGILDMRESGMGWGNIAKELGVKLGPVISSLRSSRPETAGASSKPEKPPKPEAASAAENRPEKPEKPDKPAKPEKPEKPDQSFRGARPDTPRRP